jgi:hypothetical protein
LKVENGTVNFEKETTDCILHYNPNAETQFPGLAGKAICVPDRNLIFHLLPVPFAGLQELPSTYFQEKSLAYAAQGIQLVHLWQDCWTNSRAVVCSRIAALSGSSVRIHARQTTVRRIARDDARRFFTVNHLQGFVNGRYHYGLYVGEQLMATASFSAGRTITRNSTAGRSFELLRYASMLHHRVVGGLGKLIARFVEEVNPDDVMTYADLDWASGKGYRALNFVQTAITPPQMFRVHPADMIRHYPHRLPLHLAEAFKQQSRHVNMDDFLKDAGYLNIYNAGNLKYILIRGY